MATGTWEDFTDKYGFNDGGSSDYLDVLARNTLVRLLNAQPAMPAAGLRAIGFDHGGSHNPVRIVVLPTRCGATDEDRLAAWETAVDPATGSLVCDYSNTLPDQLLEDLNSLIDDAYGEAYRIHWPPLHAATLSVGGFILTLIVPAPSWRAAYRAVRTALRGRTFVERGGTADRAWRWTDIRRSIAISSLGERTRGWGRAYDRPRIVYETLEFAGPTPVSMNELACEHTPTKRIQP
jgi:hypothetical protein